MLENLPDSACFETKVLEQTPKPQSINFSSHSVSNHICASTTLQILMCLEKSPATA